MKFTIRDLLLVTVIVALAVGWIIDHQRLAADNNRLHGRMEAEQTGAEMARDCIAALERKLDAVKPGWRKPKQTDPHGYSLGRDKDGPVVFGQDELEEYEKSLASPPMPTSQTPAQNTPTPK